MKTSNTMINIIADTSDAILRLTEKWNITVWQFLGLVCLFGLMFLFWDWLHNRHLYDGARLRIGNVHKYIGGGYVKGKRLKTILTDERNDQVFAHIFGYRLNAALRDLLHPIVMDPASSLSWGTVKIVKPYLIVTHGKVDVKFKLVDVVEHRVKTTAFVAILILIIWVGKVAPAAVVKSKENFLPLFLTMLLLLCILVVLMLSMAGYLAARRFERWLEEQEKSKSIAAACVVTK